MGYHTEEKGDNQTQTVVEEMLAGWVQRERTVLKYICRSDRIKHINDL